MFVNPPPDVRKSQLSAGLLQGLLEMPLLFGDMPIAERRIFSTAYNAAIDTEYPELLQSQQERLGKILPLSVGRCIRGSPPGKVLIGSL